MKMQYEKYFLIILLWIWCYSCEQLDDDFEEEPEEQEVKVNETGGRYKRYTYNKGGKLSKKQLDNDRNEKLSEQDVIQRILSDYNWRVRPKGLNTTNPETGGPVIVMVNIMLRTISKIDDVNMEYSAQFTFREEWHDPRLAFKKYGEIEHLPFVILAPGQQIWMPDTFFQNEKEARKHDIDKPNVLIRIYPNGKILYSVRLSLVLSCPMDLGYYPLDNQTCYLDLASYAYTTTDIKYIWKEDNPVQKKVGLERSLPSFKLEKVNVDYCTSVTSTGEYSCLRTVLILRREYSFYLIQLYIPSFMLVVVSWVNFWIDKDAVPARVSLGVTTLLTMTTQASGVNAKLPPVSYTKAVDVWIGVCLAFIFGALLEFALVNYAGRVEFLEKERKKQTVTLASTSIPPAVPTHAPITTTSAVNIQHRHQIGASLDDTCAQCDEERNIGMMRPLMMGSPLDLAPSHVPKRKRTTNCSTCFRMWLSKYKERSKRIDVISRLVFPCCFFFFNCVYWSYYMSQPQLT